MYISHREISYIRIPDDRPDTSAESVSESTETEESTPTTHHAPPDF
jgi:hypothetical protein